MTKAENNFINYADRNTGATPAPEVDADAVIEKEIDDYAPGLLNDYGGGNVMWWQDYIREEISNCNDYWRTELESVEQRHLEDVDCLIEIVQELIDCPNYPDKATIPKGGIEVSPEQVVLNYSIGWKRIIKAKSIITQLAKERGIMK